MAQFSNIIYIIPWMIMNGTRKPEKSSRLTMYVKDVLTKVYKGNGRTGRH